jgi:ribosomal protein L14
MTSAARKSSLVFAGIERQLRSKSAARLRYGDMIFFEETAAVVIRFAPEPAADRVTV